MQRFYIFHHKKSKKMTNKNFYIMSLMIFKCISRRWRARRKEQSLYVSKNVLTASQIVFIFIIFTFLIFLLIPNLLVKPFVNGSERLIIEQIRPTIIILFRFIAVFSLFESLSIIFSSAIKGAGETKF